MKDPQQNFALPESIIFYIAKNVSSIPVYHKLVKCCKYFYLKNRILSLHCLFYFGQKWYTCSKIGRKSCTKLNGKRCGNERKSIDLTSISQKIWITNYLEIAPNFHPSFVIPWNIKSNAITFRISNLVIPFNQLLLFGSSVKLCYFHNITVIDEDDATNLSLSKIIQCLPNVEEFIFSGTTVSSHITPSTVEELIEIPHFSKINEFILYSITEDFDIEAFYCDISKITNVQLWFDRNISEVYRQRIDAVVDKIKIRESKSKTIKIYY